MTKKRPPNQWQPGTVRVRESENDPANFNYETGEFMATPKQTRSNREAADGWVKEALRMRGCG